MQFPPNHLLCLVSSPSAALRQGVHLAEHTKATLHVLPLPLSQQQSEPALDRDALCAQINRLAPAALPLSVHMLDELEGDAENPIAAVRQYVADSNIDLVVTDTPPDHALTPPLTVNPLRTLTTQLECPLFIAGSTEKPDSIRRILVPTDLSDHALKTLQHAAILATLYDASIDVLHVVDSIPYIALTQLDRLSLGSSPLAEHRGRRQLRSFLKKSNVLDTAIHPHIAHGDPAKEIRHFVEETPPDLVVLSSHGSRERPRQPLGQVAERLLANVSPPLFLFRPSPPSEPSNPPHDEDAEG